MIPPGTATEKQVVARVMALYRAVGCSVHSTQQTRPSRQAIGLPDLWVMHPRIGGWWHEAKRLGGKQTTGQRAFHFACEAARVPYVLGGYDEAEAFLRQQGIAVLSGNAGPLLGLTGR